VIRLSICISTFNRGHFIGETLDSITPQLRPGVEVVVVDGASPDDTREVVSAYAVQFPAIRYLREQQNSGVDADYDKAVGYATGEYCWLATDDDLLAPAAIDRVLEVLDRDTVDLLVVDVEIKDATLSRTLKSHRLGFRGERTYREEDADAFLKDAGNALSFIGGTIIRRSLWMARRREPFFGSLFVHVGVILQSPAIGRIKVLGESLVILRAGNGMWRPKGFEIWTFKWPSLIWGFDGYSNSAKLSVIPREPWRSPMWLMTFRAQGAYSITEYKTYFAEANVGLWRAALLGAAIFPGRLANVLGTLALVLSGQAGRDDTYEMIMSSRFANPLSRLLVRLGLGAELSSAT
jgi:abequosyltransferase